MNIAYQFKPNARSRHFRLTVHADGRVVATYPARTSRRAVLAFVREKESWVRDKLEQISALNSPQSRPADRQDYLRRRESARRLILERLRHFNAAYGFRYQRVAVRDTRSRWGSCSAAGNLNFSYRLLDLEPGLRDYIIVHELCHLGELNHSARFWALVARTVPDYRARRHRLKGNLS